MPASPSLIIPDSITFVLIPGKGPNGSADRNVRLGGIEGAPRRIDFAVIRYQCLDLCQLKPNSLNTQNNYRCAEPVPLSDSAPHRIIAVGEHYQLLEQRRKEQKTEQFKERMHQRNGLEGTISELARAHGLRRSRYRGLAKVALQNFFIGTACNVKRWLQVALETKTAPDNPPLGPAKRD